MNFIAAFLLENFQDEAIAFQCFNILMTEHFIGLLSKDFKKLKQLGYIYDRWINMFHAELGMYFKVSYN